MFYNNKETKYLIFDMINFKNRKLNLSKRKWRNPGKGGCSKQIYGFGVVRQKLLDYEGSRIGMKRSRIFHGDYNFYRYGRANPEYNMREQFLLSCIGMHIDEAFSKFCKIVKRDKGNFIFRYYNNKSNNAREWFFRNFGDDKSFHINNNGIIEYRTVINNIRTEDCIDRFKPPRLNIELTLDNYVSLDKKPDGKRRHFNFMGNLWVVLLSTRKLHPTKVPVYKIRASKFIPSRAKKFNALLDDYQQVYLVGFGISMGNKYDKTFFIIKKSCLK